MSQKTPAARKVAAELWGLTDYKDTGTQGKDLDKGAMVFNLDKVDVHICPEEMESSCHWLQQGCGQALPSQAAQHIC